MTKQKKIVVFDMDETLGHFVQLGALYDIIEKHSGKQISQIQFNKLLDLYPEMIRPNIIAMLRYIAQKKEKKQCANVYIYTNNQGPKKWGTYIKNYFEHKLQKTLFDDVIGAYKIRGIINDSRRTSNQKSYSDLKTITKLNTNTKICFLDDQYHKNMIHPNIFYIYLPDYTFIYPSNILIKRFVDSSLFTNFFQENMQSQMKSTFIKNIGRYHFTDEFNVNKEKAEDISLQTMEHLKDFFKQTTRSYTKKKHTNQNKRTRRRDKN